MKTPSENLFNLIKSMDAQEKVFFKRYSNYNSDNKGYIRLFDVVSLLKIYDEKVVRKQLAGDPVINNLKQSKSYLIESILKSLTAYHSGETIDSMLFEYIHRIEILKRKQLYKMAFKLISKAERLALENERYPYLFVVLQFKLELAEREKIHDLIFIKELSGTYKEVFEYLKLYKNNLKYKRLSQYFAAHKMNNVIIDTETRMKLLRMTKDPLLADEKNAFTTESKKIMFNTLGNIFGKLGEWDKTAYFSKRNLELIESDRVKLANFESHYLITGHNYLLALTKLRNYEEFRLGYSKMLNFYMTMPSKSKTPEAFGWILKIRLLFVSNCVNFLMLDEGLSAALSLKRLIEKNMYHDKFLNAVLYYKFFAIYFFKAEYKKAILWLNKIIALGGESFNREIYEMSQLLLIVCHFELKNYTLLRYLTKAISGYREKAEWGLEFREEMILFFNKTASEKDVNKDRYVGLYARIQKMLGDDTGANILDVFDFISWLESKIEDRPFAAVIKEKQSQKKLL